MDIMLSVNKQCDELKINQTSQALAPSIKILVSEAGTPCKPSDPRLSLDQCSVLTHIPHLKLSRNDKPRFVLLLWLSRFPKFASSFKYHWFEQHVQLGGSEEIQPNSFMFQLCCIWRDAGKLLRSTRMLSFKKPTFVWAISG